MSAVAGWLIVGLAALAVVGWWAWWDEVNQNGRRDAARALGRPERLSETPAMRRAMHWSGE